jgi:hypothetical protein
MSKYILFGSTNETALHFIRHATSANLRIICLYPYHPGRLYVDRQAPLLSSLGGVPVPYNFRSSTVKTLTHGSHGSQGLQEILDGAKGVVWAAHPNLQETTINTPSQYFIDYLEDVECTFQGMRLAEVDRFLCLAHNSIHLRNFNGGKNIVSPFWGDTKFRHSTGHDCATAELISSTMKQKFGWTIIRTPRYLDKFSPMDEGRGIELGANSLDGVWREDVARTMVEVLKDEGLSRVVLDVKSAPATLDNDFSTVVSRAKKRKLIPPDGILSFTSLIQNLRGWMMGFLLPLPRHRFLQETRSPKQTPSSQQSILKTSPNTSPISSRRMHIAHGCPKSWKKSAPAEPKTKEPPTTNYNTKKSSVGRGNWPDSKLRRRVSRYPAQISRCRGEWLPGPNDQHGQLE